ncbi:tyrosine-type recombinase/integrase [Nonomuraea cypriaca]|uniref:tyrosine-type recombinase/integrase n=1 Tax=Nonomuraea cypriaca TaxID=1187855 RepID=UPI001A9C66C1|nr:site-specific integrase [Nonomuraea cypriaca]
MASLIVSLTGSVVETADPFEPYQLLDGSGRPVAAVTSFMRELLASARAPSTLRSYAVDLLRWMRFLTAIDVAWDRAIPVEGRDFSLWIRQVHKPNRKAPAGRVSRREGSKPQSRREGLAAGVAPGEVNRVTGKPSPDRGYAPRTVNHCETVLRTFYDFHHEAGTGPMVNPFPLDRSRRAGRAHAHHNPMEPWKYEREGRYRSSVPQRPPRAIPDEMFELLFAALPSHRDRALVAFWISTGARASELLGVRHKDADPGQQLITVIRKGSRVPQPLPASPDAFVWLRLYQQEIHGLVPAGGNQPLWWTRRRPFAALTYHAAHRMFERANAVLGANWTLHDLRHSAAHRMARDPELPLADVQWILGHAHLTTTQLYLNTSIEEAVAAVRAHHDRQSRNLSMPAPPAADGYDPAALDVLFGRQR